MDFDSELPSDMAELINRWEKFVLSVKS
jgi:hypothetical protein